MATMLVIDGNIPLGKDYLQAFIDEGIILTRVKGCQQAFRYLESSIIPDVILLDMTLPDGSGLLVVRYLRAHAAFRHVQIVVTTDNDNFYDFAEEHQLEHVFHKQVPLPTLMRYVKHLLMNCEPTA